MVVARKKPSAPVAPPVSRSSSSQPLPRALVNKQQPTLHDTLTDDSIVAEKNGISNKLSYKRKRSNVTTKPKPSLLSRLFFPALSFLLCYALFTCPAQHPPTDPVCRALSTYRHIILEPYIIPTLAGPYNNHVRPYVLRAQPYVAPVLHAEKRTRPYIRRAATSVVATLNHAYTEILHPYWHRAIIPRFQLYVTPHLQPLVRPCLGAWKTTLDAWASVYEKWDTIHPYFYDAWVRVEPHIQRAWSYVRPHILTAWKYAKVYFRVYLRVIVAQTRAGLHVLGKQLHLGIKLLGSQMSAATSELGHARRTYVDPHVRRIWEKVGENGRAAPSVGADNETKRVANEEHRDVHGEEITESIFQATSKVEVERPMVTPELTTEMEPLQTLHEAPAPEETPLVTTEFPPSTSSSISGNPIQSAISVAEGSAAGASTVLYVLENEAATSDGLTPTLGVDPTLTPIPEIGHALTHQAPDGDSDDPQMARDPEETEDLDIDDFLRDLGLDASSSPSLPATNSVESPPDSPSLSPSQLTEITAKKRYAVTTRHARWQADLDALALTQKEQIRAGVSYLRSVALSELRGDISLENGKASGMGEDLLHRLEKEGEKLLRGAETVLKKIEGTATSNQVKHFDTITDKVEARFGDAVRRMQGEVHEWYVKLKESEAQEVDAACGPLKALAERAQADLGLDYAWLDDVTYEDWQKYHDLMRTYESFAALSKLFISDTGADDNADSNPNANEVLDDPVRTALDNLDAELQYMVHGFAVRLSSLRERARNLLQTTSDHDEHVDPSNEAASGEYELGARAKESVGGVVHDNGQDEKSEEEPTYSILPISSEETAFDIGNVVIGKSKEQLEAAVKDWDSDGKTSKEKYMPHEEL